MENKEIKLPKIKSLIKVRAPLGIVGLRSNSGFCSAIFKQNKIASIIDDSYSPFENRSDLVYNVSSGASHDRDVLAGIIDLLLQLRAAQSDQNVFVQNNTVIREQILGQLKNEIIRVNNRLTKNQIRNLEVVSSNSFDKEALNDVLKSLIKDSKKKLENDKPTVYGSRIMHVLSDYAINKIIRFSSKVINRESYERNLINKIYKDTVFEDSFIKDKIINLNPEAKKLQIQAHNVVKDSRTQKELKEILKIQKESVQPEISDDYEKNVLKIFKEVLPIIKTNRKIVNTSFLENLIRFVTNKEKKPIVLNTVDSTKRINKVKNIYEKEIVNLPLKDREFHIELINRKFIAENLSEKETETTEKINFINQKYSLKKDLVSKVHENNILLKEFKTKIDRQKNILKHTKLENKFITDEKTKTDRVFELGKMHYKNLVYKTEIKQNVYDENIVYKNTINDVFKKNFKKDIIKTQKEIKRNVNVLKKKDIQEKINYIFKKGSQKTIYQEEAPKFIYNEEFKILKDKTLDVENIVKNVSIYKQKEKIVRKAFENVIQKNITKMLLPKTVMKSKVINAKEDVYKNIITGKINKYITTKKEFVHKDVFANVQNIKKEFPVYVPISGEDYMIYKKEIIPEKEIVEKKKASKSQTKIIDKFEKDIKLKPNQQEIREINEKQIEENIMAKMLKKSEVQKMIRDYMSEINLDSISKEVMERVEDKFMMSRQRNGTF